MKDIGRARSSEKYVKKFFFRRLGWSFFSLPGTPETSIYFFVAWWKNFNIFKEINKIHRQIKKSTAKSAKKSLINGFSKRLIELEFVRSLNKIKLFKLDCQKNTANNIRHEKHTIKKKSIKLWKKWNVLFRE